MFTAGNMTYMRKRKKERAAAQKAVARENVRLLPSVNVVVLQIHPCFELVFS